MMGKRKRWMEWGLGLYSTLLYIHMLRICLYWFESSSMSALFAYTLTIYNEIIALSPADAKGAFFQLILISLMTLEYYG